MGIFSNDIISLELRSSDPLDNPSIPLSSPAAWELFGTSNQTESGETITERTALSIVTVYGCIRVIAQSIASMPLRLMENTGNGHREATDQNLYYLLSTETNPDMTAYTFIQTIVACIALTGNGYAQIERNLLGQPVALWPLHPWKTTPKRAFRPISPQIPVNSIYFETTDGESPGKCRNIPAEDVLHFPSLSMDGLKGLSPIALARRTLGLAVAQEKSGSRFFGNNSRPGGLLLGKGKIDIKALQEIRQSWEDQQGGLNNGRIAVIPNGDWSYQAIGLSNEDSQWIQSRGFGQAQIAQGIFGVPPHLIGDMARLSGSNSEQMSLQFATYCLQPYLKCMEDELVRKLIPRTGRNANRFFVEFDESQLLRCDFATTMTGYSAGRIGGWYSANDVRRKLGENPGGAELDIYLNPVNYTNAINMIVDGTEQQAPKQDTDADGPDSPVDSGTVAPTLAERNLLGAYTNAYLTLYRDSFKRVMKRNKRDYDAFNITFRAVLESISRMALGFRDGAIEGTDAEVTSNVVDAVLRSMAKRSSKWPTQMSDEETSSLMINEFNKAVRSIHIDVSKTIAAARAVEQLNSNEDQDEK